MGRWKRTWGDLQVAPGLSPDGSVYRLAQEAYLKSNCTLWVTGSPLAVNCSIQVPVLRPRVLRL